MIRLAGALWCASWLSCRAVPARAPAHVDAAKMICGGHAFHLDTAWRRGTPPLLVWHSQALLADGGKRVDLDEPADKAAGALLAVVTGWQCVAGTQGDVLVLAYPCASDGLGPCRGQHEWFHLVSPLGSRLDAGYKPQDDRLDGLLDRLGLARQMSQGLSLQNVIK